MTPYDATPDAIPLELLKGAPWNPRTIRDERFQNLCLSIQADPDFLWLRPVLAMGDGTIYAGNMRFRAAQHLGMATIPAIVADIPEKLARERALRDNAQWGEWDDTLLADMLDVMRRDESDMTLLGFDDRELVQFLAGHGGEPAGDPDAIPEPPAAPTSRRGDVWLLGPHRIMCGDSREEADVARLMGGQRAGMMWTDPPYGVSYVGKTKAALTIENDGAEDLPKLLAGAFGMADYLALERLTPWYVCRPAGDRQVAFITAILGVGWRIHEDLLWVKDSMVLGHSDYHLKHETIMYGYTQGNGRAGRGKHFGSRWYGPDNATSVFDIPRPKASVDHPTMKPVALVAAMVENSSPLGGLVYDPFMGSGTTLIACEQLGRVAFGMELDPGYVDVIRRRFQEATGIEGILEVSE